MRISDWNSDVCSSDLAGYSRTSAPPLEPGERAVGRDDFGDLDAIAPVDMDDLAARDQRAVGIDVEQVVRGAVEFDHAALAQREQVGERHRRDRKSKRLNSSH